jgi:hypothetical protein
LEHIEKILKDVESDEYPSGGFQRVGGGGGTPIIQKAANGPKSFLPERQD